MKTTINQKGFSLLELIVVLAGLGILSSLALPNFMRVLDFNNIDAVKALLNSAAADCLQNSRLTDSTAKNKINDSIINATNLEQYGYKISDKKDTCQQFSIESSSANKKDVRFPIGFSVMDGKLTKTAKPSSSDQGSMNSCKKWAGINCTVDDKLQKLLDHKKNIQDTKDKCNTNYEKFLKNPGNGETTKWDSNADKGCPDSPTENYKTSTCTSKGCVKKVWVLKETPYFTKEAYDEAVKREKGENCAKKLKEFEKNKKTNSHSGGNPQPLKPSECDPDEVWFFEGSPLGSKLQWQEKYHEKQLTTGKTTFSDGSTRYLCMGEDKKTEALMTKCKEDNKSAVCEGEVNKKKAEKFSGKFIANATGPGVCSIEYWLCEGVEKKDENAFNASSCGKKDCGPPPAWFCSYSSRYNHPNCSAWAKCNGYI